MDKDEGKKFLAFYKDMQHYSIIGSFKFAYQSKTHWMVSCLVAGNQVDGISYEDICGEIAKKFSSRSTLQRILDNGIADDFFLKSPLDSDKRVQLYRLTEDGEKQMEAWVKRQTEIFTK
ncbi:MarR family winged helix-turn-helix transcriptional regulator [Paracoccaceae bacterium]|jgi:DNA-binding MarR family transcriptional regulator|nr:MarR family winged helix-turn-helix transcriptional regulator [Paracoccaceae bacterium]